MNVIRWAVTALLLCALPIFAAEWRVASISSDYGGIAFLDAASIKRTGEKVTFKLDQRWAAPRSNGSVRLVEDVESDCVSRSWTAMSTSQDKKLGEMKMTIKTVAGPGTVYDAVLTAACTGAFRSGTVADRARYAAAFFGASGSTDQRLDAGNRTQPGYVPPPESITTQAVAAPESNTFASATVPFSLTKPDDWRFVSLEESKRNRGDIVFSDPELQATYERREAFQASQGVSRLVTLEKRTERFGSTRPNVQVSVRALEANLPDPSPKELLDGVLQELQKGLPDIVIESPVRAFKLAGHPAADYVTTATVRTRDGRAIPVRSRMIIVVGHKFIFFIALGSAPRDDRANEEFEKILTSITIGK